MPYSALSQHQSASFPNELADVRGYEVRTRDGDEKVGKVDGRMTQESYDKSSQHGEYSVLVADRFMVQATGEHVSMDDLKAAVNAVGVSQLEGLAKKG